MNDKTLTLKALMRSLTDAAAYANNMLRRDCAAGARGGKLAMPAPRPLCLAGMRVSFTANVRDDERSSFRENGGDISLDFGNPNGNFKGEIVFRPCGPEPDAVYGYDDEEAPEPAAGEGEPAGYADGPDYAPEGAGEALDGFEGAPAEGFY